jgi:hypothetical protein
MGYNELGREERRRLLAGPFGKALLRTIVKSTAALLYTTSGGRIFRDTVPTAFTEAREDMLARKQILTHAFLQSAWLADWSSVAGSCRARHESEWLSRFSISSGASLRCAAAIKRHRTQSGCDGNVARLIRCRSTQRVDASVPHT